MDASSILEGDMAEQGFVDDGPDRGEIVTGALRPAVDFCARTGGGHAASGWLKELNHIPLPHAGGPPS